MTTDKPITHIAAALARGAEGKPSVHSRKSLEDQRARRPKAEPEVTNAKVKKAVKKASPKKAAKGAKLALKQNKEVRSLLRKAAEAAGGSRLQPIGFTSFTEFLAGVPLDASGSAEVVFIPVKGNEPIKGKNVKLIIKDGKVVKVK